MSGTPAKIVHCPAELRGEAVALVLSDIAPSQRREIAGEMMGPISVREVDAEALYVAMCGEQLIGAAWGQRQPGNTAVLWPPRLISIESLQTALQLATAVAQQLDRAGVELTQALLPSQDSELVSVLIAAGFTHLADLLYLSCEAERFPVQPKTSGELQFVVYDDTQHQRLINVVERTYEGTLDCRGLNGRRRMEDVIAGYRETGAFSPDNWLFVVNDGRDVGVALLASHPHADHWELMYMGLVPEARGQGWGHQIVGQAQWLARCAGVARIVLAVDTVNQPALAMYERAGFCAWDRRSVFVRILRENCAGG